jgi:hypothetical protein
MWPNFFHTASNAVVWLSWLVTSVLKKCPLIASATLCPLFSFMSRMAIFQPFPARCFATVSPMPEPGYISHDYEKGQTARRIPPPVIMAT